MKKLLVIGDHFIRPSLMRASVAAVVRDELEISEASTPFPLEPFRDIAEVKEASGSEEQMIEVLRGISLCIAHHALLTKRVLQACPDLRLFLVCRGGPVNVNLQAATAAGVTIGFTPGRNAVATAEFSVAMALAALRRIPATDFGIRNGQWPGNYTFDTAGFELEAMTCGVIGYGEIGRRWPAFSWASAHRSWSMTRMPTSRPMNGWREFLSRNCSDNREWFLSTPAKRRKRGE